MAQQIKESDVKQCSPSSVPGTPLEKRELDPVSRLLTFTCVQAHEYKHVSTHRNK